MLIKAYLVIEKTRQTFSLRTLKEKPTRLNGREVAVQMNIDIPSTIFERPIPVVELSIPKEAIVDPNAEVAMKLTAKTVAESLNVDVNDVIDGLSVALDNKQKALELERKQKESLRNNSN